MSNIKLGWKWLPLANTLAYNDTAKITAEKSFIVQASSKPNQEGRK